MRDDTFRTLNHIKTDIRLKSLIRKNRYIPPHIYNELKHQKVCDYCHQNIINEIPEIHHIVSIKNGGTNCRYNLQVLHKKCHEHIEQFKKII